MSATSNTAVGQSKSARVHRPSPPTRYFTALESSRLIHRGARRNSFAWNDDRDLVVRAHIRLKAPIVFIWDNLNIHRAAGMREYAAAHDWLRSRSSIDHAV